MDSRLEMLYGRYSVRRFTEDSVPKEDLVAILEAGTMAPSGKNSQNWHFIVVTDRKKIEDIAGIVENKIHSIADTLLEADGDMLRKGIPYATVFKGAPVLILMYTGPYPGVHNMMERANRPIEEVHGMARINAAIQNTSAAFENILLAAAAMGYGTCWMVGPAMAAKEITEYLDFKKEGYFLSAVTPLGVPESTEFKRVRRKEVEEVSTFIE